MKTITIWEVPTPEPNDNPDFSKLIETCKEYIAAIEKDSEELAVEPLREAISASDLKHFVFEHALEAVFGEDVWKFVNERSI